MRVPFRFYSIALSLALSTTPTVLAANSTFVKIDFPGATFTTANAINPHGDIVGTYLSPDSVTHGFLLQDGEFTSFDFPGAIGTEAYGINPRVTLSETMWMLEA